MALDLAHAAVTGQFPFPGALRDQPARLVEAFRLVVCARASLERARVVAGGA